MFPDGRSCKASRLGLMGSTGLAGLLDSKETGSSVITAVGSGLDESSKWGLERTVAHVLDIPPLSADAALCCPDNRIHPAAVRNYLEIRLQSVDDTQARDPDGVLTAGDGVVVMDRDSASGDIGFDDACLLLESKSNFSSARSNACVWRGRWMYEATLGTAGIQQLGWATLSCPFTDGEGVGDAADSYAYDGKRVKKWNVKQDPYGQAWVTGDVIGCCIDVDAGNIHFYRNGLPLGLAFEGVKTPPTIAEGYYPAISLSHGERCQLNFGGRPFKHPIQDYLPVQAPPTVREGLTIASVSAGAAFLFGSLQRLVQLGSREVAAAMPLADRFRRYTPISDEDTVMLGSEICSQLALLLSTDAAAVADGNLESCKVAEYCIWGSLVPFLINIYRPCAPHDGPSLDRALDLLLPRLDSMDLNRTVTGVMDALAYGCKTSPFTLEDRPYTGSYRYLALACHLLRSYEFMAVWWRSSKFQDGVEGLLTRKGPNKHDLEALMPTVWWPGSREDLCSEQNMRHAANALFKAITKVEELQWELCCRLLHFVPPSSTEPNAVQVPGLVFRQFLRNLIDKNRGANRNVPPPGLSDNSVLVSAYCVVLRFLSEGLGSEDLVDSEEEQDGSSGFLHRGGKLRFPVSVFLKQDSYINDFARLGGTFSHVSKVYPASAEDPSIVEWDEGCVDEDSKVNHDSKQKPCCCWEVEYASGSDGKTAVRSGEKAVNQTQSTSAPSGLSERSNHLSSDFNRRTCNSLIQEDKPDSSGRVDDSSLDSLLLSKCKRTGFRSIKELFEAIREEELLDSMVLLYHLGLASNFKQASYCMQHQIQLISHLDDTDRQIRAEKSSSDQLKRLKEARTVYREDLIECVRQCTWFRVSLFSRWKQRGMYATCMWIVQLLLVLSKKDRIFRYIPEFYVETLVDTFHALRRSDPPFVSPSVLLQHGLAPLVTFLVTHFNDQRIVNSDIRDVLLQSISVLVQYKEHVVAFENNQAAREGMIGALLSAFDNRFWIPVSNILLRLCKGKGFGASKGSPHGEPFSVVFQQLLRKKCILDDKLFSSFLNRLFNTLNWTITEFSVSIKEMQELPDKRQVPEVQQRKCTIMFELSCNLARILEFFTQELPQAFLAGAEMNLIRLCELIIFVLNHTTSSADAQLFDSTLRLQGQSLEKVNRSMILAPLVGIVLNLAAATDAENHGMAHDIAHAIANVDASSGALTNFQYLLEYNWGTSFKGDSSLRRVPELQAFVNKLQIETEEANQRATEEELLAAIAASVDEGMIGGSEDRVEKVEVCSICYACEIDTMFTPCKHQSCLRCISRHLLNNQRCFFCNATIAELSSLSD